MMNHTQLSNLFTFVHDKGHLTQPGKTNPEVDTLFSPDTMSDLEVPIWRGMSRQDTDFLEGMAQRHDMFRTYPGYLSFSESRSVACSFTQAYRTRNLMQVIKPRNDKPRGICLPHLFSHVPDITEDEQDVVSLVEREQEWIFRRPRVIILSVNERHGYKVWRVKLITL